MRKLQAWNSIFHTFYADALRRGGRGGDHLAFVMGAERECMQRAHPLRAQKGMLSSPRKSFKMPNSKEDRFATAFLESSCRQQERKFISLLDQGMALLFFFIRWSKGGPERMCLAASRNRQVRNSHKRRSECGFMAPLCKGSSPVASNDGIFGPFAQALILHAALQDLKKSLSSPMLAQTIKAEKGTAREE